MNEYGKKWRGSNLGYLREYARRYMREHPEANRLAGARWYANPENRAKHQRERLERARANRLVHNAQAIALKRLPTQQCEIEGCETDGERHHDDYTKPLEVKWLCRVHHKELHRVYQ